MTAPIEATARRYLLMALVLTAVSLPVAPVRWHFLLLAIGLILFAGNLIVSAAWMAWAERTGDSELIAFATRSTARGDLWFTGPGAVLVLMNGLAVASERWPEWRGFTEESWLTATLILSAVAALIWAGFLLRYQIEIARLAADQPPRFHDLVRRRVRWSAAATTFPMVALFLTLTRPALW